MQALFPKHNYSLAGCEGRGWGWGWGISLDGSEYTGKECGIYAGCAIAGCAIAGCAIAGCAGFVRSGLLYLTRYGFIDFEEGLRLCLGLGPPSGFIDLSRLGLDLLGLDFIIFLA